MAEFNPHGFQEGEIFFPGIDLRVEARGKYFRDDGIVRNLQEHSEEVAREFGYKLEYPVNENKEIEPCARHLSFPYSDGRASIIFIKDLSFPSNTFNYGHESTHAVRNFGLEEDFLKMLINRGFNINPFKSLDDEEQIAHFGGFIALHNLSPILTSLFASAIKSDHPECYEVYQKLLSRRG